MTAGQVPEQRRLRNSQATAFTLGRLFVNNITDRRVVFTFNAMTNDSLRVAFRRYVREQVRLAAHSLTVEKPGSAHISDVAARSGVSPHGVQRVRE